MATNYIEAAIRGARRSPTPKDALEMEMMLPDYGFGPMTQVTKSGRPNPELSQGRGTLGERTGRALLEYGPLPAKFAVEVAKQPVRAGEAVGEAAFDPTLANVTNAGVQTGLAIFQPAKALMALGGGYGVAAARDIGADKALVSTANASDDPLDPSSRKRLEYLQGRQKKNGSLSRAEREEQNSYLKIIQSASTAKAEAAAKAGEAAAIERAKTEAAKEASSQAEYDAAVKRAESARAKELEKDIRFSETEVGKVWNTTGGFGPAIAGAGMGAISRVATGGGNAVKNYLIPAGVGGVTGAAANNIPLAFNAFGTEPDNPERRAYEAYARELPPGHPRKVEWQEYASRLPIDNPVRKAAADELYDPVKAAERIAFGAIEGVAGGIAGADIARIPGRLSEGLAAMPGRVVASNRRSMADADRVMIDMMSKPSTKSGSVRSKAATSKSERTPEAKSETISRPSTPQQSTALERRQQSELEPILSPMLRAGQPQAKPLPQATSGQPSSGVSSSAKAREIPLSKTDKDKISNAVYQKLGRDGSLDGLTYQDLGIKLSGKSATPDNVSAYIQQLVSVSDDLAKAGVPPGARQAELLKRIRASKLALPATVVAAGSINYLEDARNR